ncbi:Tetracyclin repressor domain-containing protein [Pseudofrankia inefficax]|uniref:Tetracyclin repressor domain-containing protein n=1 Tax=Pseudofrankia inefficax (strain DSM 45817 / CECT 9037 / DDB 130130 / EuI1c) TaxID=298654 RepID=E3J6A4_PSEI1|nr:Tetracyclin repressor domain-containing protein [Pseudofrankia inefficax]
MPTFSREEMIAAARRLGPDAANPAALAAELGVARTSIYWHVRDRSDIGELVLGAIIDEGESARWSPQPARSWNEVMESYARVTRAGLMAAGGWIRFATPRLVLGQGQLRAMDDMVARLRACGFSINDATRAYAFLIQVVLASIGSGDAPVMGMHRALLTELETVEANELTTLREVAAAAAKTSPDAQFEYDLDCALRGIAARSGVRLGALPTT